MIPLVKPNQTAQNFPRGLADDMSTYATGPDAVKQTIKSFLFTHEFLTVMGAVVRTPKTWAFAHSTSARKQLAKVWFYPDSDQKITVITSQRDLGGHIDTTKRGTGTTLNKRVRTAAAQAASKAHLPTSHRNMHQAMLTKYTPQATYAVATTPMGINALHSLTSTFTDVLVGTSPASMGRRRSTTMTLYGCAHSPANTVAPKAHILKIRILEFRRFFAITPSMIPTMKHLLGHYRAQDHIGLSPREADHAGTYLPLPMAHRKSHAAWRPQNKAQGPLSLLLQTLTEHAAHLNQELVIISPFAPPIDVLRDPIHVLKKNVAMLAENVAFYSLHQTRPAFKGVTAIDRHVTLHLTNKRPPLPEPEADIHAQYEPGQALQTAIERNNNKTKDLAAADLEPHSRGL